jgi:hypothetical protein
MTNVQAWQARHAPLVQGDRTAVAHILVASLSEATARAALSAELRHRSNLQLVQAGSLLAKGDDLASEFVTNAKALDHAAEAIDYGADAVEVLDDRYELVQATQKMSTPTSTE